MTVVLHIDASVALDSSLSRAASARLVEGLAPSRVIRRDVVTDPLPYVDDTWAKARLMAPQDRSDADKAALTLSDSLIDEIMQADVLVFGLPIYNFGMPASLKAWVDLVARPGVTFHYTAEGPRGLIAGKRAVIAVASGGTPTGSDWDYASTHLRHVLGFLGITEVEVLGAKDVLQPRAA